MTKLTARQLGIALAHAFTAATESADIAVQNAVGNIIEREAYDLDSLLRLIHHDPVDFILVAAPGFSRDLKRATGRDRNEWAALL